MFRNSLERENREASIRANLLERLKEVVQSLFHLQGEDEVLQLSPNNNARGPLLGHCDNTNALCSTLEAIFIHGLRDTLGDRMSALFGTDPDRMPVPNFWPVVMVVSHRDLMEQIMQLPYITSDVGKSRAWMRLAINQGQLNSYLSVIASDTRTLKDYYKNYALLRDAEHCDIMLRVLQPISSFAFNLATNAAVLNTWTQTPLVWAGLWAPSSGSLTIDPILTGTDIVSTSFVNYNFSCNVNQEHNMPTTPVNDRMFELIMSTTPETDFISQAMENTFRNENLQKNMASKSSIFPDDMSQSEQYKATAKEGDTEPVDVIKSKNVMLLESAMFGRDEGELDHSAVEESPDSQSLGLMEQSHDRHSMSRSISLSKDSLEYERLIACMQSTGSRDSVPPLLACVSVQDGRLIVDHGDTETEEAQQKAAESLYDAEHLDFEILPPRTIGEDSKCLLLLLTMLPIEQGLDAQNFKCNSADCGAFVGMIYGKPKLCHYDKKYYCTDCHEEEISMIPSRIIHNWDFRMYPVCNKNMKWLEEIHRQPLINMRTVNPKIYRHVDDLAELQMLRTQLLYIRAYLFTCRENGGKDLRRVLWPDEHLYEHVHLYSVYDLHQVSIGKLVPVIARLVTQGREHILRCPLCSARGFICEVCQDPQAIYPFQLGDTTTCPECCGVFHKLCIRGNKDCVKCTRLKARRSYL